MVSRDLHRARRANTPVVNVIGDHATWHQAAERPARQRHRFARDANVRMGALDQIRACPERRYGRRNCRITRPRHRSKVATLIVPSDCQWDEAAKVATPRAVSKPPTVADGTIKRIATLLKSGKPVTILLGGPALSAEGLKIAARIGAGWSC